MPLSLIVYHGERQVFDMPFHGPLVIGRQQLGEAGPYCRIQTDEGTRVIVASLEESSLSRQHVRMEPCENGDVRVVNLSKAVPIATDVEGVIEPNQHRELGPPFALSIGDRTVRVEADSQAPALMSLANATMAPGMHKSPSTHLRSLTGMRDEEEGESLVEWMYAAMAVFQSAASSPDFLQTAAQAVVDLVELDTAAVIRWDGQQWQPEAVCTRSGKVPGRWQPSNTMLEQARHEKRTFRNSPNVNAASLMGVQALVAAPILNAQSEVIGAIYGDRRHAATDRDSPDITHLEAMLVELLASGVAAGLARLEQEREALAARVRFEQVFTPELAQQLEAQPDLLTARDAEISVLFCDVRAFSRISERLGAVSTFAWISDVMEELSECVQRFDGVLVDYIGDEIIAMWGTPVERPDHAVLACRAALDMIRKLDTLNQRWEEALGEPMSVGVGVNTGWARVGNTGTKRKFKYGPLGNTVNLASRVQGATKHLKANVLVTGYTIAKLGSELHHRRLSRVRVVNIDEPVDMYELVAEPDDRWLQLREGYEAALDALERKEFFTATKYLGNLVAEYPDDGPAQLLLSRSVSGLIDPADFDPVWTLGGK